MLAAPDPIKIGLVFVGVASTSFVYGTIIFRHGWRGLQKAEYPLSQDKLLTGFPARLAAGTICLFGLITIGSGVAATVFGYRRVRELM